jgi:hypothetical protein
LLPASLLFAKEGMARHKEERDVNYQDARYWVIIRGLCPPRIAFAQKRNYQSQGAALFVRHDSHLGNYTEEPTCWYDRGAKRLGRLVGVNSKFVVMTASDWPRCSPKASKLLAVSNVVFGCWTSLAGRQVFTDVEELNGLLFYPVQYEVGILEERVLRVRHKPVSNFRRWITFLRN